MFPYVAVAVATGSMLGSAVSVPRLGPAEGGLWFRMDDVFVAW